MITLNQFLEDFSEILLENEKIEATSVLKKLNSYDSLFVLEIIQFFDEKYFINLDIDLINHSTTLEDLFINVFIKKNKE
jgi:hypothetical protein